MAEDTQIEQPLRTGATDHPFVGNAGNIPVTGMNVPKGAITPPKSGLQIVQRPDGKWQQFKASWTQERIDKYFKNQGWVKKDGKWLTQSGESPSDLSKTGGVPITKVTLGSGGVKSRTDLQTGEQIKKESAATDYMGKALPDIGGAVGGLAGGSIGAGIGGAAGEGAELIMRGVILNEKIPNKEAINKVVWEGAKQAALQKGGEKAGEYFFKLLNKIPRAQLKDGIPFLPSEYHPSGKLFKYVEDLLGNLAPSAKVMSDFKAGQSKIISDKIEEFAQGAARFHGTSEEAGMLVQNALRQGQQSARKGIDNLINNYIRKGYTIKQAENFVSKTNLYKDFVGRYENELVSKIIKTNKPELIAGLLRGTQAGLSDTRILGDTLSKLDGNTLGKVQNRLLRDFLSETLTGSKDPVAKISQELTRGFSGDKWKAVLDHVGEEKLKAIFGKDIYDNMEKFTSLVGVLNRGGAGSGVGRFLNLMFLLPFRGGLKLEALTKTGVTAYALNRAAKMITSTKGIELTNLYVKATLANAPRLVDLAIKEISKFNERSDAEMEREELQGEHEYEQEQQRQRRRQTVSQ